ncbi:hypothetical protein [Fimbriimonas ginsengisoli]|nr:hypothetical protein [Fimbriimonas ginsengisoli]
MSPLLGREGLNDVISLYNTKNPGIWQKIAKVENTTDYFYRVLQEGDMGPALAMGGNAGGNPTGEAAGIQYDDFQTPYTKDYYPLKRGIGFAISSEAMESDKYGVIARKGAKMAKSMNKTLEADVANFMNLATSSGFVGPDGQPLASSSHGLDSGVGSNIVNIAAGSSSSNYLALGPLALEQAIQELVQQQSHRGDPMMFMGPYKLYVASALWGLARRIVDASGVQGTNTSDPNWAGGYVDEVVMDPYFTSPTAWALRSSKDDEHGLTLISRRENRTKEQFDIDKDAWKYTLTRIWAKAIEDWRGFIYSPGA